MESLDALASRVRTADVVDAMGRLHRCFGPAAASPAWASTRWPSSSFTALAWSDYSPSRIWVDRDQTISLRAIVE